MSFDFFYLTFFWSFFCVVHAIWYRVWTIRRIFDELANKRYSLMDDSPVCQISGNGAFAFSLTFSYTGWARKIVKIHFIRYALEKIMALTKIILNKKGVTLLPSFSKKRPFYRALFKKTTFLPSPFLKNDLLLSPFLKNDLFKIKRVDFLKAL